MPCGEREECEAGSDNNKHIVYGKVDVLGMRQEITINSDLSQPCRNQGGYRRLAKKSTWSQAGIDDRQKSIVLGGYE